jgi:beta-glucanase (GH16 family)
MRFLFPFLFSIIIVNAQLKPILLQIKKDTIISWNYHFGDEFYGDKLNTDKWYNGYPWGGLVMERRIYAAPEMTTQKDGLLHLGAKNTNEWRKFPEWMLNPEQAKKSGIELRDGAMQLDYLTSCIWSKKEFKYGYFECRCKAPQGKGLWPAFWLYGQNQRDEIDIMEMKGEKDFESHVDIHCPNDCDKTPGIFGIKKGWGGWVKMKEKLTNNWVIFSGVWMPNSLTYYVNGVPVSHFEGDFATPMNVIANLDVARDNGPFSPGPDKKTVFPNEFQVDYIRVWKPVNDPLNHQAEKWEIPRNYKTIAPSSASAKIKRKVRHVYSKKKLKNAVGFISLIPQSDLVYVIQTNGEIEDNLTIEMNDHKNTPKRIPTDTKTIDLSAFPKGNYTLKIEVGGLKTKISIEI